MATTTNYGWTTPDDTALVKDGAAAIRTLGSSVDSTTKALNPSTTLGDIEYRSSTANTNTRLGIGTSGQLLTVSGAGVPEWATPAGGGGMTLLSTTTLSGTSTTISSINQGYTDLQVYIRGIVNSTGTDVLFGPNSTNMRSSGVQVGSSFNQTGGAIGAGGSTTINVCSIRISNYTNTTNNKAIIYSGRAGSSLQFIGGGFVETTSAITSIRFATAPSASFDAGTVEIWGVK